MAKSYEKLIEGPMGLGKGKVIYSNTFTDEKFSDINKRKLKASIGAGMCKEIDAVAKASSFTIDNDSVVSDLEEKLANAIQERDSALSELAKAKGNTSTTWKGLKAEELKEQLNQAELKAIVRENFPEYEVKRHTSEDELIKFIVEGRNKKSTEA